MQRVCVNAEGTEDSQRGPLGLGRVDDCPRRAEEIGFSESHEGRFVWHDRTRVRRAGSVGGPRAGVGGTPPSTPVARIPLYGLGSVPRSPAESKSCVEKDGGRGTGLRPAGGGGVRRGGR